MTKVKCQICLLIFYLLFFTQAAFAQTYSDPRGAESAPWFNNDFQNQNDPYAGIVSLNYFTGTATVNIPLYQYKIDGIDLGLSLSYSTEGIKVDQPSPALGLGWNISGIPTITRQVRGNPDDFGSMCINKKLQWQGYWNDAFEDMSAFYSSSGTTADPALQTVYDTEPDIFYLSFEGRNIKFMISKTGSILTIPTTPGIKIVRNYNHASYSSTINGLRYNDNGLAFSVYDEKGNKFDFVQYHLWGNDVFGGFKLLDKWWFCDSWVVSTITTYEGQVVRYDLFRSNLPSNQIDSVLSQAFWEKNNNYGVAVSSNACYDFSRPTNAYEEFLVADVMYPNGTHVDFRYSPFDATNSTSYISSINVYENPYNINFPTGLVPVQYTYKFNNAYFKSPDANFSIDPTYYLSHSDEYPLIGAQTETTRLKLKSIDYVGTDGTTVANYYSFTYSPVPLPPRENGVGDIYQFANNQLPQVYNNNNNTYNLTINSHSFTSTEYPTIGINKAPSSNVGIVSAEALFGITNSKGGQIDFNYSCPNDGGGLILSSIYEYDGFNHDNDIYKWFSYSNETEFPNEGPISFTYTGSLPGESSATWTIYTNSANVLNTALNGPRHGYGIVEEKVTDNSSNQVRRTVYNYSVMDPGGSLGDNFFQDNYSNGVAFGAQPFTNKQYVRFWGVGLPTSIATYDNNNNIIKNEIYTYNISTSLITDVNFKGTAKLYHESPVDYSTGVYKASPSMTTDDYYPFSGCTLLTGKQTQIFTSNTTHVDETETYTYDANNTLKTKSHVNSLGQTILENYYYNYNWAGTSYNSGPGIASLNADNVQSLIYTEKWKNYTVGTTSYSNLISLTANGLNNIASGSKVVRPYYTYQLATSTPLTSTSFYPDAASRANNYGVGSFDMNAMASGNPVANFRITSSVKQYDDQGNALDFMDVGGHRKAIVYDNILNNTLAEVTNATYNDIAYCGFESYYLTSGLDYKKGNWTFDNSFISATTKFLGRCSYNVSSSANTALTATGGLTVGKQYTVSFWLKSGGSVTSNDGINPVTMISGPTYNGWTLKKATFIAKDNKITISGSGYVDELKLYPANAIMTTHNYLPLVGKTADVDANDNITYYEYDPFGVLTVTKDQYGNVISKSKNVTHGAE